MRYLHLFVLAAVVCAALPGCGDQKSDADRDISPCAPPPSRFRFLNRTKNRPKTATVHSTATGRYSTVYTVTGNKKFGDAANEVAVPTKVTIKANESKDVTLEPPSNTWQAAQSVPPTYKTVRIDVEIEVDVKGTLTAVPLSVVAPSGADFKHDPSKTTFFVEFDEKSVGGGKWELSLVAKCMWVNGDASGNVSSTPFKWTEP